ncbi:MAG: histidine kinase dimerization/phosphoacceptor domain -containing protein [Balneolaceae bacterium]
METTETAQPDNKDALAGLPNENFRLLLDTIEGINQTNEFKSALVESMESVRLVMNSEASSLMLLDKETGELFISMPTGPAKNEVIGKRIPENKGIGGWVLANRRPYLTNNVELSEHFYGDITDEFKSRNILCVPLINRQNEVIGVLQAINRRNGEEFTPHHIPVFQALASHVTIAIERTRQIDLLHDRLKEKDAMLTEVHHRIKNNLQILSGQIENELTDIKDDQAKKILQNMIMRVNSMSKLHDLLCEKNLEKTVDLGDYLKQLSDKIEETMSAVLMDVMITLRADSIKLPQEKALLCGLILNELIINIYKHAFIEGDKGNVEIDLIEEGGLAKLTVSDNGVGLPDDFNLVKEYSIGMWIVGELIKKLGATLESEPGTGTRFMLSFSSEVE